MAGRKGRSGRRRALGPARVVVGGRVAFPVAEAWQRWCQRTQAELGWSAGYTLEVALRTFLGSVWPGVLSDTQHGEEVARHG